MNEDRYTASVVKKLLDQSAVQVSPDIQTKLDQAISKSLQLHALKHGNPSAPKSKPISPGLAWLNHLSDWLGRPALSMAVSALFVVGAGFGVAQYGLENHDAKISETADVDAAILSDDLPPDAYLDSGFINYATELKEKNSIQAEDGIEQWMDSLPPDFTTSI